jgi:predicted Zn-dependent protease
MNWCALKAVKKMTYYDDLTRKLDTLPREPNNHALYNDIGVMLYERNDYINAQKYLERAWALSPSTPDILYNYAHALYACFDWPEAIEMLKAYLELQRDDKAAIEMIAEAYYQLGDYRSAARYQNTLAGMENGL